MISAKEEPDVTIPPAVDGLQRIHKRIVDADTDPTHAIAGGTGAIIVPLILDNIWNSFIES